MIKPTHIAAVLPFFIQGCAPTDRVVFVTNTQLDIGYDVSAGSANFGYNRDEGVTGPSWPDSGTAPPIYAHVNNSGNLLAPKIKQVYAMGTAATRATAKPGSCSADHLETEFHEGAPRLFVFGTSTNFGFKVRFINQIPESLSLGWKRKEFSWVPVNPEGQSARFPDLLAFVAVGTDASQIPASYDVKQFIATGNAAKNLACSSDVQEEIERDAAAAISEVANMN